MRWLRASRQSERLMPWYLAAPMRQRVNEIMHGMSTQPNALWGWTSDAADASLSLDARF